MEKEENKINFFKGFSGSILCSDSIPGITQELPNFNRAFFGGKYFICESVTPDARDLIIKFLNEHFSKPKPSIEIELKIHAYLTVKHIDSGYFIHIIPAEDLKINLETDEDLENLPLREYESKVKKLAMEKIFRTYGHEAEVKEVLLINKGDEALQHSCLNA